MAASRSTLSDLKEQLLAWPLAISLLSVSGYHYLQSILKSFHIRRLLGSYASASPPPFSSHYFLPITTLSYTEKHEISPKNIDSYIHKLLPKLSKSAILSNPQARKLFNQILSSSSFSSITHDPKNLLVGLYPVIINTPPLPPDLSNFSNTSNTTLSVIVPCYNESLPSLCETLTANLQRTSAPSLVEVVIVDAGGHSPNFEATIKAAIGELCAVSFVAHRKGGGRGPAQNAGAQYASSPLLSFLHADTLLPLSWDTKIIKTLMKPGVSSCAFNFGIAPSGGDSGEVPGIRAIAVTANLRTRLYDLPYGDQCLSISKQMFGEFHSVSARPVMKSVMRLTNSLITPRVCGRVSEQLSDGRLRSHCSTENAGEGEEGSRKIGDY